MARNFRGMAAALALVALGQLGCATCKTPPPFHVSLEGNHDLNGNLTTKVMLLQLKSLDGMAAVEFDELRKNPAAVLGPSLIGEPTMMAVSPGEAETRWVARDKDAKYIAAVGIFQSPSRTNWWAVHKLGKVKALHCREVTVESLNRQPLEGEEQMRFYLRGSSITTEGQKEGQPPQASRGETVKEIRCGSGPS